METSQTPVIPIRQAMVRIAGYEVLSICMANDSIGAGVRMICGLLGVSYPRQLRKLQSDPDFRDCLIMARVEIAGQQRVAYFIIAEFIPLWLKGIHPSKVAPEARETLEEFRSVAVQTLRAYFFPQTNAQPQAASPRQPPPQPPQPSPAAPAVSVFDMLRAIGGQIVEVANRMEQEYREMEAWRNRMERQHDQEVEWMTDAKHQMLLQREEMEIFWSIVLGKASATEDALSADHHQTLEFLLRYHQRVTGQPRAQIQRELLMAVGVADLSHLQEKDWKQIVTWFRQRLGW